MIKTEVFDVVAHWCRLSKDLYPLSMLTPGKRYILIHEEEGKQPLYQLLSMNCSCKKEEMCDHHGPDCSCQKTISKIQADWMISIGQAEKVWKARKRQVDIDYNAIWLPQQRQVPRIDLISQADIERAYIESRPDSIEYIEEVHKLFMENRAKLIVPFRPDPTEGRLIFPFSPEQRTSGSYAKRSL